MISERLGDFECDNLINYWAGPVYISINIWEEEIKLSANDKWSFLLKECLETAKQAWNVKNDQIRIKKNNIYIKFNFDNLKMYINYGILFL